jgi:hypothetical protein
MASAYKSSAADADPRLRTRTYARNFDVVYQQFFNMVRRPIKGWWLEDREMAQGILRAKYQRLLWRASVTFWVRKLEGGGCEVDVESADAPTGRGGNHRKRVLKLLAELDDALLGENPFNPTFK